MPPRDLDGVTIDVESLFAVSVDFSHLRVTITAILDALKRAAAKSEALERIVLSSQAKVDALEKTVAAGQTKIEALDSTVASLGSQVRGLTTQLATANERLNVAEKLGAEAAARIVDLEAKDALNEARIAALEKGMKVMEGYKIPQTFADHQARIAALEASDKELRALLALGNDKADAAAKAAAAAAAAAGKPIPIVAAAPVSNGTNNDALLQRIKSALEALTTRVAALEARPLSAAPVAATAAPPAVARVPSKSGSNSGNIGASDFDRDQLAQHARQLAASATEMAQIQAALAELKKLLATKASLAQLDKKADTDSLRALEALVEKLTDRVRDLEREVAALKDQIASLQDSNRSLAAKLQALLEASSCGVCHAAKPSVKCAKCNLSLREQCDENLHGAAATPAMQAHLRTPLMPIVSAAVAVPEPSSHRSSPAVASSDDELRRWAEEQFGLLNRKEKATRADINDLGNKERDLRAKLEALLKTQADDKQSFADMAAALKKLEADLRALINTTGIQGRNYTDSRLDELLAKLREMEKSLDRGLRSELKRFERDVLVFLESHDGSHQAGSDAAVGKIHFRCLSCDQTVGNLQGPASLLYARAVGSGANGSTTIGLNGGGAGGAAGTNMSIERGRELYLAGRDGAVYKGRDPSNVSIALGDPQRPSSFAVQYANQSMGSTTNPRAQTILDQKTVMAPYAQPGERDRSNTPQSRGGMRPQSAPYEDPGLSARSNASSLPPTRPATRSGLRSRQGGREETTPVRELTQQQQQQQQLTGSF